MIRKLLRRIDSLVTAGRQMENSSRWQLANPIRVIRGRVQRAKLNGHADREKPLAEYGPFEQAVDRYKDLREDVEKMLEEMRD